MNGSEPACSGINPVQRVLSLEMVKMNRMRLLWYRMLYFRSCHLVRILDDEPGGDRPK